MAKTRRRRAVPLDSNLAAIRALYDRALDVRQLQEILGLTERSTYHLLERLRREGVPVEVLRLSRPVTLAGGPPTSYRIDPTAMGRYLRGDLLGTIERVRMQATARPRATSRSASPARRATARGGSRRSRG